MDEPTDGVDPGDQARVDALLYGRGYLYARPAADGVTPIVERLDPRYVRVVIPPAEFGLEDSHAHPVGPPPVIDLATDYSTVQRASFQAGRIIGAVLIIAGITAVITGGVWLLRALF